MKAIEPVVAQMIADHPNCWSLHVIADMLSKGICDICMQPFAEVIEHGRGQLLVKSLHHFMNIMGHYNRVKVVRGYVGLCESFQHMAKDDLRFYLQHCTTFNDNHIENYHSLLSRLLPQYGQIDFKDIHFASSVVHMRHVLLDQINRKESSAYKATKVVYGADQNQSTQQRTGEVVKEELQYQTGKSQRQVSYLKRWILAYLNRLIDVEEEHPDSSNPFPPANPPTRNNIYTFGAMLANGKLRNVTTIVPNYCAYLDREVAKATKAAAAAAAAPGNNPLQFLQKVNNTYLKAYLRERQVPRLSTMRKNEMIDKIQEICGNDVRELRNELARIIQASMASEEKEDKDG